MLYLDERVHGREGDAEAGHEPARGQRRQRQLCLGDQAPASQGVHLARAQLCRRESERHS